jgi:hypothetical protein
MPTRSLHSYAREVGAIEKEGKVRSKRWRGRRLATGLLVTVAAASVWAVAGSTATSKKTVGGSQDAVAAPALVRDVALARAATTEYVTNLALARQHGYRIITRMIPNMGYHYMNPKIAGFDPAKPPILVYEHTSKGWQLGAVEWVFTKKPAVAPIPGATYGAFGAGCHYADGTYVPATAQSACTSKAPGTGAGFTFWHPNLVTLHLWLWHPNPSGIFSGTNPLVGTYNAG